MTRPSVIADRSVGTAVPVMPTGLVVVKSVVAGAGTGTTSSPQGDLSTPLSGHGSLADPPTRPRDHPLPQEGPSTPLRDPGSLRPESIPSVSLYVLKNPYYKLTNKYLILDR